MARRPSCTCGVCTKCKRREYMRTYRARTTNIPKFRDLTETIEALFGVKSTLHPDIVVRIAPR